jgi:error-prone DNA polymerase
MLPELKIIHADTPAEVVRDAGVVFITLSDETSIINVVVWPKLVETFRREIMGGRLLYVKGKVQRSPEGVVHLVADQIFDRSYELARLSEDSAPDFNAPRKGGHPRNNKPVPKSSEFH